MQQGRVYGSKAVLSEYIMSAVTMKEAITHSLSLSLSLSHSTTMIQVLRMYCQKKQLDVSQFIISLPPDSSQPPVKPSTTVGSLRSKEVQVVKKASKPSLSTAASASAASPTEGTDSNGLAANEQVRG